MADKTTEELERLRHELQALSLLVEHLYVTEYRRLPDGAARFAEFQCGLKKRIDTLKIPGAPAVLSDHAKQGWVEAVSPILDRISDSLAKPRGPASRD